MYKKFRTDAEEIAYQIKLAMLERGITAREAVRKSKIANSTFYEYLRAPGRAPLVALMAMLHAVGVQQITLKTGGYYKSPPRKKKPPKSAAETVTAEPAASASVPAEAVGHVG